VICRQEVVARLHDPDRIDRLVVLPANAPTAEWIAAARYIHQVVPVDAITNYTERDTDKTAAIATALGLPATSAETYRMVADKLAMRGCLAADGVDDTLAGAAQTRDDVLRFADTAGYPLICKPVTGVGSRGVTLIPGPDGIDAALARARDATATLDCADVMVEQFHRGAEFSVEALSEGARHIIVCITKKIIEPRTFVEIGHVLPAPVTEGVADRIASTVTAALDALGITDGVTHTEVIVTAERVRIVETHLRPAGDQIPYLLARASGIDLIDALARRSVGMSVIADVAALTAAFARTPTYAAIRYAMPDRIGEVQSIEGLDEARALPGVCEVAILIGVGERLDALAASSSRPAYAWATGHSAEQAWERARQAVDRLTLTVTPVQQPPA
jgi:biotin carboxylase